MLFLAHRACDESVASRHGAIEQLRHVTAMLRGAQLIVASLAYQFGNKRIGMLCAHIVHAVTQRVYYIVVIKILGKLLVALVGSDGIEVIESLVDAAELVAQHQAPRFLRPAYQLGIGPVGHLAGNFEGAVVAAVQIGVDKSGQYLMERVPRRPHTFTREVALYQLLRKSAEIA